MIFRSKSSGQMLLEIAVTLSVVLLLVTGLIVGVTATIKKTRLAQDRSVATKYAQEGMEFARLLRNKSWSNFRTYNDISCQDDNGTCLWCLDSDGAWSPWVQNLNECGDNISHRYSRLVFFDWVSNADPKKERMHVTVIVAWRDGISTYRSNVESDFTQWQ